MKIHEIRIFNHKTVSLLFKGLFGSIQFYSLFFSLVRTKNVQSFLFCFLNLVNLTRNTFFAAFRIEINFWIKWNSIKSCQKRQNRIVVSIASIFPSLFLPARRIANSAEYCQIVLWIGETVLWLKIRISWIFILKNPC